MVRKGTSFGFFYELALHCGTWSVEFEQFLLQLSSIIVACRCLGVERRERARDSLIDVT